MGETMTTDSPEPTRCARCRFRYEPEKLDAAGHCVLCAYIERVAS